MEVDDLFQEAEALARRSNWRIGQALFNHLDTVRPDIADILRGTPEDPFFASSTSDPRYVAAVAVIVNEWKDYT